jgi:predicted enzyme related to lactoylglutathione lyase
VGNVEEARGELAERGVAFHGETFDTGVCQMAHFSDPDGNVLMLHRRYAE